MVRFDTDEINEKAKEDYEKAWKETAEMLDSEGREVSWDRSEGDKHPVLELSEKFREVLLSYGFDEIVNPTIIEEDDVYKEYGPEAAVILDRCFYLAGLPRPDLGIDKKRKEKIEETADVDIQELKKIFREYKKGEIESDDLVEELVTRLDIDEDGATKILSMFDELRELEPQPTDLTLRSHTTAAWFPTLSEVVYKRKLPIKLFSIAPKYRREQKLDSTHTYRSLTASLVAVAENITVEDGKALTRKILKDLGFDKIEMEMKEGTSKYYAPDTEFEVFVKHPKTGDMIEIGNGGLYSPVPLSKYSIPYPVFNVGFGVERISMMLEGEEDIRHLLWPYRYKEEELSDEEIADMVGFRKSPKTEKGEEIRDRIAEGIKENKDKVGPDKFLVYEDDKIEVYVSEPEEGKELLGPAGMNEIYVLDGNIRAVDPEKDEFEDTVENGVRICSYIESISNLFARKAEEKEFGRHTVKFADSLPAVNLELEAAAEKYITSHNKKIEIGGPIFVDVEIEEV